MALGKHIAGKQTEKSHIIFNVKKQNLAWEELVLTELNTKWN